MRCVLLPLLLCGLLVAVPAAPRAADTLNGLKAMSEEITRVLEQPVTVRRRASDITSGRSAARPAPPVQPLIEFDPELQKSRALQSQQRNLEELRRQRIDELIILKQ